MSTLHKHAALIIAWAQGAKVQILHNGEWTDSESPMWSKSREYRLKPIFAIPLDLIAIAYNSGDTFEGKLRKIAEAAVNHLLDTGQVVLPPEGK